MRKLSAILFWVIPVIGFSQEISLTGTLPDKAGHNQLFFVAATDCEREGVRLAETDLAKGSRFLLLQSGLVPTVYSSDRPFEQKFGVQYFDEGCSAPATECMKAYNARVFRFLQRNYAKTWWKDVRKDVVGFKEWKKAAKL